MRIAAKHSWEVVRLLSAELRKGNHWFIWQESKTFYSPADFFCFPDFESAKLAARQWNDTQVIPVGIVLRPLERHLYLNAAYPRCVSIDVRYYNRIFPSDLI